MKNVGRKITRGIFYGNKKLDKGKLLKIKEILKGI